MRNCVAIYLSSNGVGDTQLVHYAARFWVPSSLMRTQRRSLAGFNKQYKPSVERRTHRLPQIQSSDCTLPIEPETIEPETIEPEQLN